MQSFEESVKEIALKKGTGKNKINPENTIFCFWHNKEDIPPYLLLCKETWKKYYPDFDIIELDLSNIKEWLPEINVLNEKFFNRFRFQHQANLYRALLLYKYGGYWLDYDTIIFKKNFFFEKKKKNTFYAIGGSTFCHTGMMYSDNSSVVEKWVQTIVDRVHFFDSALRLEESMSKSKLDIDGDVQNAIDTIFKQWHYFSSSIVNPIVRSTKKNYVYYDRLKNGVFLEIVHNSENDINVPYSRDVYTTYYFNENFDPNIIKKSNGLVYLHNSWTPREYKAMSKSTFLKQDIPLSRILEYALNG